MCGWQIKIFDGDKSRGVANATLVGSFFSRENVRQFLLVEKHRIGGKSLFGGSVACTFFAPTELSVRLIFLPEPNRDANTQHFGSSVAG